jgi:sulfur carrier protein ThiS adenylyltransferase
MSTGRSPGRLPEQSLSDRDIRQRLILPPDRLASTHALVVGVGAVGRQAALQLTAMGVARLSLFDPDTVRVENLACQGYSPADLGRRKVEATADDCKRLNPGVELTVRPERFRRSSARYLTGPGSAVVFTCVDRIGTRRLVWESCRQGASFFVDGRMSAEVVRVLSVADPVHDASYATTLFAGGEAYAGSCTAKATIYTASIAAGLMLGQFSRWLRRLPVDADLTLNVLSTELTVAATR